MTHVRRWALTQDAREHDRPGKAVLDLARPGRRVVREARHLHELERVGESEWTPWIAISGLFVFLATIFLIMAAIAEAAYYLAC